MLLQSYGSGGYSDRSGRCQDAMGCSSQRDGALRRSVESARSAVSTDRVAAQPQQMASATVLVSERALVCTQTTAVDAEMA